MVKRNRKSVENRVSKNGFKIGLYIRVSTEEQAKNLEGSIRNQEQRLRTHVEYKLSLIHI